MEPISIGDAIAAMGATVVGHVPAEITSVCTDTRQLQPGALFFALQGENTDGHRFVPAALAGGAVAAVVDHRVADVDGPQLLVSYTLAALGDLAAYYRLRFNPTVIGITGSVGKTSTKELIALALNARFRTLVSERNFNNEIGVPHTLFRLDASTEAAEVEMGMRGAGQIARLAEIARPSVGVITNIGLSHIEMLGSREAIAAAKGELIERLPAEGLAVLPADDDFADYLAQLAPCPVITFGTHRPADYRVERLEVQPDGSSLFTIRAQELRIPAPGAHHAVNAAAACAVACELGVPLEAVAAALSRFTAPAMRMETVHLPDGTLLINDAYNAAPDSMRAALETLSLIGRGRRRIAILGEMRELGAYSIEAHAYAGGLAAEAGLDLLVAVGDGAKELARVAGQGIGADRVVWLPDSPAAAARVHEFVQPGDAVLIKGSRAVEMETVVSALAPEHDHGMHA